MPPTPPPERACNCTAAQLVAQIAGISNQMLFDIFANHLMIYWVACGFNFTLFLFDTVHFIYWNSYSKKQSFH